MSKRPSRREFPASVKRDAAQRSQGVCECHRMSADIIDHFDPACSREAAEFDHIFADTFDGEPTLENCAHLSTVCHKIKTALDAKARARRNRHTIDRDKARAKKVNPKPKAHLKGRGFDKRFKKSLPTKSNPFGAVRPR